MIDIAYETIIAKGIPVSLKDIWARIKKERPGTTDDRLARFYTNLTLDGRFIPLGGNMWNLRKNYSLDEIKDINSDLLKTPEEEAEEGDSFDESENEEENEEEKESDTEFDEEDEDKDKDSY